MIIVGGLCICKRCFRGVQRVGRGGAICSMVVVVVATPEGGRCIAFTRYKAECGARVTESRYYGWTRCEETRQGGGATKHECY